MKSTKTNGKRRVPAKDVISHAAAKAFAARIDEMIVPKESWKPFGYAILNRRMEEIERYEAELSTATGDGLGMGQLLCALGEIVALRRLSTAQLFELGSSEEAMRLCTESLARGLREPAGDGEVIRFPRFRWVGDPLPKEAPPEEEDEDETFAGMVDPET